MSTLSVRMCIGDLLNYGPVTILINLLGSSDVLSKDYIMDYFS